ncbi:MAG: hypothetical protein PVF29_01950 [Desulfobacterales bacterium]|jgi:SSS family solute:Na+ symporter
MMTNLVVTVNRFIILLGAPAFVAFATGGGLIWLQFELAVPLAEIILMALIFPLLKGLNLISALPLTDRGEPNYSIAVLVFVLRHFPHGLIGWVMVGGISDTIVESINKIGSLLNGLLLAVFMMAMLTRRVNGEGATLALYSAGILALLVFLTYGRGIYSNVATLSTKKRQGLSEPVVRTIGSNPESF